MRAILIDAKQRIIREVDWEGDVLPAMYSAIGCKLVEPVHYGEHDLWVDEEGMINDLDYGFVFRGHRYFGNGPILSSDKDGESVAALVDVAFVRRAVKFWST